MSFHSSVSCEEVHEAVGYGVAHVDWGVDVGGGVNSVFRVNSEYDFCIETIHKSIKELDEFLHKLEDEYMLREYKIYYLVDEVKREGFCF